MNVYIVGLNQIYDIEIDKVILKIHVCNTAKLNVLYFLLCCGIIRIEKTSLSWLWKSKVRHFNQRQRIPKERQNREQRTKKQKQEESSMNSVSQQ
jgi:hypothetical protein